MVITTSLSLLIFTGICGNKSREPNQVGTISSTMNYLSLPGQSTTANNARAKVILLTECLSI